MAASGVATPPAPNGDITSDPAWVVQKFGGTSVGKFATNIVDQIILYAWVCLVFFFFVLHKSWPEFLLSSRAIAS